MIDLNRTVDPAPTSIAYRLRRAFESLRAHYDPRPATTSSACSRTPSSIWSLRSACEPSGASPLADGVPPFLSMVCRDRRDRPTSDRARC